MPMSKDQKWTVGTGIAVVIAVLVIVASFQPHLPASQKAASADSTPGTNAAPAVSPTPAASPIAADPTISLTPIIISTPAPMEK
jgi:hypothetical protein